MALHVSRYLGRQDVRQQAPLVDVGHKDLPAIFLGKGLGQIDSRHAVAIAVLKDEDPIAPVGGKPRSAALVAAVLSHPNPSPIVPAEGNGLRNIGLRREHLHLQPLGHRHLGHGLLRLEKLASWASGHASHHSAAPYRLPV